MMLFMSAEALRYEQRAALLLISSFEMLHYDARCRAMASDERYKKTCCDVADDAERDSAFC